MPSAKKQWRSVLDNYLVEDKPNNRGEQRLVCPFHDDVRASASVNFQKEVWHCKACDIGGSVESLAKKVKKGEVKHHGIADGKIKPSKKTTEDPEPISIGAVEGWHSALMSDPNHLSEIKEIRGILPTTLKKYLIGYDKVHHAFTIPVLDLQGRVMNIRRYRPRAQPHDVKIWNVEGMGRARIYPVSVLENAKSIVISAGEMDALISNQYGFPTVTGTAGEGTWLHEWGSLFAGKKVYICYDNDDRGRKGRRRVAANVSLYTDDVYFVDLGIDEKGADLTNFYVDYGFTRSDFKRCIKQARPYKKKKKVKSTFREISLVDSFNSSLSGEPLAMTVTIIGKKNPPYSVPKKVAYSCSMDAGPEKCAMCPMIGFDGEHSEIIPASDPRLLKMIDVSDGPKTTVMRQIVGIPECNKITIEPEELQSVEDLYVIGDIDKEKSKAFTERRILNVGTHETPPNSTAQVVGTLLPNPKNQHSEFLSWQLQSTESAIDRYEMTQEKLDLLSVFRPTDDQRPIEKLKDIADDLSHNVTKIYGRADMHMAMDLVFHSVLQFDLLGQEVTKGWLEGLIIGDTRTGKSEAVQRLQSHYGAGTTVSCESASFAGIFGGLSQRSGTNEWSIRWGAIPINDRRLVALDEVSGLRPEEISQLSSIRSSGEAQLTKINAQRTSARTRLIWISNPRAGKLGDYVYGMKAIQPLIGNPEDIARFDFAMSVAADEVDSAMINSVHRSKIDHVHTADLCNELVLWAWSRRSNHVRWARGAQEKVLELSVKLGERYVEDPPLIQGANVRTKIARLSVALAVRTFSTDKTGENVIVKQAHVVDVVRFLESLYRKESFGYYATSRELHNDERIAQRSRQRVRSYIETHDGLARYLRQHNSFRMVDLMEMRNIQRDEAQEIIEFLHNRRMVTKRQAQITVLPALNEIVRSIK